MTAEREMARVVRSWLREDEHDSADRVLEIVLARTWQETAGLATSGLAMLVVIAIVWVGRRRPAPVR